MVFYLIIIIVFAVILNRALPTDTKSTLQKRILDIICYSYLLLGGTYLFFDKVFSVSYLSDIQLTSISRLYMLLIWSIVLALICLLFWLTHVGKNSIMPHRKKIQVSKGLENILLLCGMGILTFVIALFSLNHYAVQQIQITEICAEEVYFPDRSVKDEYIELYNPTQLTVQLAGCAVTDDPDDTTRHYPIPDTIVPALGYAIVDISEDCPFSIRSSGEDIYLLRQSSNEIIDAVAAQELPESDGYVNWTFAKDSTSGHWAIHNPSPAKENITSLGKNPVLPQFSADSGFYDADFYLTLSAPEGYSVYYTLDSSSPDAASTLYTAPIHVVNRTEKPNVYLATPNLVPDWKNANHNTQNVDKGFVVRAVTVDQAGRTSEVVSKTYFVDLAQYSEGYVLSVVTDYNNLIGDNGICITGEIYDNWYLYGTDGYRYIANYYQTGRQAEVPANIELLSDNQLLLNTLSGLRLQGASTREGSMKRLRLISRECYSGNRYFDFPLFDTPNHSFYSRSSFADGLADIIAQQLLIDTEIAGTDAEFAHVFVNGEYWYHWPLSERYDEDWISHKFQLNSDDIVIYDTLPEEIISFTQTHDMSSREAYEELSQQMDMQNYITFSAANIYYNNTDIGQTKNLKIWKTNRTSTLDYQDEKYRFLLYDLDFLGMQDVGIYGMNHYEVNTFSVDFPFIPSPYKEGTVFWELKKNEQFRQDFVLTFLDLANTYFDKDRVAKILESRGQDRTWNNSFFDHRAEYIIPHLANEFDLNGTLETVALSVSLPEAGSIRVNSVTPELTDGQWSGKYYTDYPITITAEPKDGYEFTGWYHQGEFLEEPTQEVLLCRGDNLWQAQFRKVGD